METCQESLPILKAHEKNKFQRFVTGDKSWFTLEFHCFTNWNISGDDMPQKGKQQIRIQKFMLAVIWGIDGFHVVDLMTEQHSDNTQYFFSHILEPLLVAVLLQAVPYQCCCNPVEKRIRSSLPIPMDE
jgi:hypothetical protein